ncbi:MAG TPA: SPFH domain-containing protein [Gemmatales bacterium]|nr:SPFH domain-containing protein [Gemmatales bacterium]
MTEVRLKLRSGWPVLPWFLLIPPVLIGLMFTAAAVGDAVAAILVVVSILGGLSWLIGLRGFFIVNPNESRVIQLFGEYIGTVKEVGFYYGNPFYTRMVVSLRVHTFETGTQAEKKDAHGNPIVTGGRERHPSKVNDKDGTPIEIAAVVVWQVVNTADAVFQVDNYEDFVRIQSEAALRNLASQYPYDSSDEEVHSLRSHTGEVADRLKIELEDRLHQAGVHVIEARISYLAYASEIAAAMLQRQQAAAVIAARQKIVEGAVGMVEHALEMLSEKKVLELDEERKAAMVSNLLVVLCGHASPQPVLNTGSLHG